MQDRVNDVIKHAKLEGKLRAIAPGGWQRQAAEAAPKAIYRVIKQALTDKQVEITTYWPRVPKTLDWSVLVNGTVVVVGFTEEEELLCCINIKKETKVAGFTLMANELIPRIQEQMRCVKTKYVTELNVSSQQTMKAIGWKTP